MNKLCRTSIKNSHWVWNTLRQSRINNFKIGEESLTDFVLLDFLKIYSSSFISHKHTKHKEAESGGDWEWWIRGVKGDWLGLRFQAKVIDIEKDSFEHLFYENSQKIYQVKTLISDSKISKAIPLYCLYSNWDTTEYKYSWPCNSYDRRANKYGISLVDAYEIESRLNTKKKDLRSLLDKMTPWHCMLCCGDQKTKSFPRRIFNLLKKKVINPSNIKESSYIGQPPPYIWMLYEVFQRRPIVMVESVPAKSLMRINFDEEREKIREIESTMENNNLKWISILDEEQLTSTY